MEEVWKPIEGYEGIYEISNLGRIKSLSRDVKSCYGHIAHRVERIKVPKKEHDGYMVVSLYKNSAMKTMNVHRLVAMAFVPNPHNYPCINHKDENKTNNFVFVNHDGTVDYEKSNLEWCTYKYNSNYGTAISRTASKRRKKVVQYDISGNQIAIYNSIREAARLNGICESGISSCCSGRKNYGIVGGFVWKLK